MRRPTGTEASPRRAGILLLVTLLSVSGFAQENSGRIAGTIKDPTGAAIPGAKVTATSPTLPRAIETASDDQGRYTFQRLPIGAYTVGVAKQGFRTPPQHGLE